ncbi:MAG: acylphosphatase [Candidatus Levybacteria bacterium]|nr:acylphosphatase [Candidatus Levybacteria bacterium]
MTQVHLLISGFVQGVGYRAFVRSRAQDLELTGWVRNLSDNRVEAVAQGEEETLKKFINICEKGPFLSEVKNIAIEWQEPQEQFESFEKRPTE